MQTILDILKRAGGWHPGLSLKIDNPPYMPLVIEAMDESGPCGLPALSVAHYGEQNGDLMRDPEMCFELGFAEGRTSTLSTGATTTSAWSSGSRSTPAPITPFTVSCISSTFRFAKVWDRNLRSQGFAEAFEHRQKQHA